MAESSGRGAGKSSSGGPGTPGGSRTRGRRVAGGRVFESRYLQQPEKKAVRKATEADAAKTGEKVPERGRRPAAGPWRSSCRDASGAAKGDLQSTLLEGHGTAPPDLDLSAINDRSISRRTPQPERSACGRPEPSLCAARRKSPRKFHLQDLPEAMEMVDSQTLLLTLLTVKMENSLVPYEEEMEKKLLAVGRETERLRRKAHGLRRRFQLGQRLRQLVAVLDSQITMLSPCEAVVQRFREQYQALASALDTTRHELPVSAIHLDGDGSQLLDDMQRELLATRQLLGELGLDATADPGQALERLQELKSTAQATDLELQRSFAQLLELSAEASKDVALGNQEAWEETRGMNEALRHYFSTEGAWGEPARVSPTKTPAP